MANSGFKSSSNENNVDLLDKYVTKSYLIDVYPHLTGLGNIQMAGLWAWGRNDYGRLGDNSIISKSSPVQTISGGNNWKSVSVGYNHTAAIKTDGTLWNWGYNISGQLGDNSIVYKSSPVQTIAMGSDWKTVSCGVNAVAATKTDGTLWSWGSNNNGRLGDNSTISKSSPVQTIAGGSNWKSVSATYLNIIALQYSNGIGVE